MEYMLRQGMDKKEAKSVLTEDFVKYRIGLRDIGDEIPSNRRRCT